MTHSVSIVWFALIAGTGIYNITFFPGIFRAFDPSRAVLRELLLGHYLAIVFTMHPVFVRTKNYDLLAGIVLALTGCEAVFAKCVSFKHSFQCGFNHPVPLVLGSSTPCLYKFVSLDNLFYYQTPHLIF